MPLSYSPESGWPVPPRRPRAPRARALLAELHPDDGPVWNRTRPSAVRPRHLSPEVETSARVTALRYAPCFRGVRHVPSRSVISRAVRSSWHRLSARHHDGLSSLVVLTQSQRRESNSLCPRMKRVLGHRGSLRWERDSDLNRGLSVMSAPGYQAPLSRTLSEGIEPSPLVPETSARPSSCESIPYVYGRGAG